jgi:hypothetical protein
MIFSAKSAEFYAAPRAQSLFKACADLLGARTHANRVHAADHARQLDALLAQLGLAPNSVAIRRFGNVDGATERAISNISGWMGYLSHDCVASMVRDGWHWST